MTTSRTAARRPVVVLLLAALIVAPFFAWQSAQGGEDLPAAASLPQGIVVVGDSITALYDDEPGSPAQGWWSFVGRRFNVDVTTYAQSGSGYLRLGDLCTGDRFIDRTGRTRAPHRPCSSSRVAATTGRRARADATSWPPTT